MSRTTVPGFAQLDLRTQQCYLAIVKFYEREGYFPSMREIAPSVGLTSSSSVRRCFGQLSDAGYLEQYGPANRYRLTDKEIDHAE